MTLAQMTMGIAMLAGFAALQMIALLFPWLYKMQLITGMVLPKQ